MASALIYVVVAGLSLLLLGGAPANAVDCGDIITRNTVLTEDLECVGDQGDEGRFPPALTVVGPAKLNLNGYTVRCSWIGWCVALEGRGAVLRSGTVYTNVHAVVLTGSGRHIVRGVSGSSVEGFGFAIDSDHNRLFGNTGSGALGSGFVVFGSHNRLIGNTGDRCSGFGFGPCFRVSGTRNILRDNVAIDADADGESGAFEISGERNQLIRNIVTLISVVDGGSNPYGIRLFPSAAFTRVVNNTVSDSDIEIGIDVGSDSNIIVGNQVHENGIGIRVLAGAERNRIVRNDATGNETLDLVDENPDCDNNVWRANRFGIASHYCIR